MKNLLLKFKQWFLNLKTSTYFQLSAGVLILIAFVIQALNPKQFNAVVLFTELSYLTYVVYDVLNNKNK